MWICNSSKETRVLSRQEARPLTFAYLQASYYICSMAKMQQTHACTFDRERPKAMCPNRGTFKSS
jgi:hypothetical protein